jgi:hypothetical protein
MRGKAVSAFFLISSKEIMPMGCGTIIKLISAAPFPNAVSLAREMNSEVAIVTVGKPILSRLSWSTTSHEVQAPQSD